MAKGNWSAYMGRRGPRYREQYKGPEDAMTKRFSGDNYRTFTPGNLASMESFGDSYYKDWASNLTDKERDAIWTYRERAFSEINDHLRGVVVQTGTTKQRVEANVAALDSALNKSRVPYNVVTFRGGFKGDKVEQGSAYVSTSLNSMTARRIARDNGANGVLYRIKVRAGAKGAYVDQINSKDEGELLLPRNKKPRRIGKPKRESIEGTEYTVIDVEW